jgi:hypothetical protein
MYRINQLPRKVLITPDEVIALGPTHNSVDPRNILLAIQIAEDRFIKPAICKDLYNDFRNKKNVVVTEINKAFLQSCFPADVTLSVGEIVNAIELVDNQDYVDLWNEQLWKLVAECVVYIATPTNFSRYTAAGEMVNNPKSMGMDAQGSATVDLKDMKWKLDKMLMDRIDPLIAPTQEYICDNISKFPLYNCRKCECENNNGISYKRKTGWIHMYKEDCRDNCNDD